MMDDIVTKNWQPHQNTINALNRRYISKRQFENVLANFIERYEGKPLNSFNPNPNTVFKNMFDKMHGEDTPKPDLSEEMKQDTRRKQDIKNNLKASQTRVKNAKLIGPPMSPQQIRTHMNVNRFKPR